MAVPWLFRMTNVLTHYRGFSVPSGKKISAYLDRLFEDPTVKSTCSNEDLYLDSYARYAENRPNTSQVSLVRLWSFFSCLLSNTCGFLRWQTRQIQEEACLDLILQRIIYNRPL